MALAERTVIELTRRELFRLCAAAGLAARLGHTMSADQGSMPMTGAVDHLLLGTSDLDRGIAWVEKLTGVRAPIGGSHPGVGTRNALISLGGRQYLEIIAPDPAQTTYTSSWDVRTLTEPRLITWAAATADIDAVDRRIRGAGREVAGPNDGSRARPDGTTLKWRTIRVPNDLGRGGIEPLPFFIEWSAETLHPSQDSPKGCTLRSLELVHPNPSAVTAAFRDLGLDAAVRSGTEVRLIATVETPKGSIQLT
jgi:hypothetical protein